MALRDGCRGAPGANLLFARPILPACVLFRAQAQLTELLTAYNWTEVWFDGGVDTNVNPLVGPVVQQRGRHLVCHSCLNFSQDAQSMSPPLSIVTAVLRSHAHWAWSFCRCEPGLRNSVDGQ